MISRIWTQDATGTPIVSGATATIGVANLTLVPPVGAQGLKIKCSAAMRWGDNAVLDGSAAEKGYVPAVAEEWVVIPTTGRASIYVALAASTGNFHFFFYAESGS